MVNYAVIPSTSTTNGKVISGALPVDGNAELIGTWLSNQ